MTVAADLALSFDDDPWTTDHCQIDSNTGEFLPVVTVATDHGGPFRSVQFEAYITADSSAGRILHSEYLAPRPDPPKKKQQMLS